MRCGCVRIRMSLRCITTFRKMCSAKMDPEKKRIEQHMLSAARDAGIPIPFGEEPGEAPDFRFSKEIPPLGIETSEVLRPASSNFGIVPVEEESFHKTVIASSQAAYYSELNARVVHVNVYFTNTRGARSDKRKMADALTEFVRANNHRANPSVTFMRHETQMPKGYDAITIIAQPDRKDWWSGEGGGVHVSNIRPQVETGIRAKDKLVPIYRSNLPHEAQIWLLLYTGVTVARSMPIPYRAEEWAIHFQFDRVFWFTSLEREFVEIRRA
jgi:hypothetical protein